MDPLASEKSISYAEPAVYPSRDFVTVHVSERPKESGRWWKASETFDISLRNIAQNELIDASTAFLEFGVVVDVPLVSDAPALAKPLSTSGIPSLSSADIACHLPGVPHWGVPFFSSVSSAIPGLGTDRWLDSEGDSQVFSASRLMCSSGVGGWDESSPADRLGFKIAGKPQMAGAKSVYSRAQCAKASYWAGYQETGGTGAVAVNAEGQSVLYYRVPLSLFSRTFNACSSMVPIAYYSSGSDLINFKFTLAPDASALNQESVDYPLAVKAARYYILDPCISFTKTQINSPAVLSVLESMFRGVASVQIAEGVSAPVPMVQKHIDYSVAKTTVVNSVGQFQLPLSANQPSCRAVLLRVCADAGVEWESGTSGRVRTQYTSKYVLYPSVVLENLQLRIGSMRVPLDSVSDIFVAQGSNIPGLPNEPVRTSSIHDLVTRKVFGRMYNMGKNLFSPFSVDEDISQDALACFDELPVSGIAVNSVAQYIRGYQYHVANATPSVVPGGQQSTTGNSDGSIFTASLTPNLWIFPFESFAHVFNQRLDAFSLRGLDLRNISQMSIVGRVSRLFDLESAVGGGSSILVGPYGGTWTLRGVLAFDSLSVLLAGRIDRDAQFSLIPSGATSVPTM